MDVEAKTETNANRKFRCFVQNETVHLRPVSHKRLRNAIPVTASTSMAALLFLHSSPPFSIKQTVRTYDGRRMNPYPYH